MKFMSHKKTLNCMLQAGPPSLHYYCAVACHLSVTLQSMSIIVFNLQTIEPCLQFLSHFKVFIWLSLLYSVQAKCGSCSWLLTYIEKICVPVAYIPSFFIVLKILLDELYVSHISFLCTLFSNIFRIKDPLCSYSTSLKKIKLYYWTLHFDINL